MTIIIDMSNGVTENACERLMDILNIASLRANNKYRAEEGKPPLTEEQQIRLYGKVVSKKATGGESL